MDLGIWETLETFVWDLSLGELGLGRPGEPVDGHRGNRGGQFDLPGL